MGCLALSCLALPCLWIVSKSPVDFSILRGGFRRDTTIGQRSASGGRTCISAVGHDFAIIGSWPWVLALPPRRCDPFPIESKVGFPLELGRRPFLRSLSPGCRSQGYGRVLELKTCGGGQMCASMCKFCNSSAGRSAQQRLGCRRRVGADATSWVARRSCPQ